jgi:hypothetical protein
MVSNELSAQKFMTARDAARVYGVHKDYFRKCPELRRQRIELTRRIHLYPVTVLDSHFFSRRTGG